jgi:hypothetical protein
MRGHRAAHGKHTASSLSPLALEALAFSVVLPHRPQRPVLLPVDQEFGGGAALRVAPEPADPVDSVEVGKHEDVEQLGEGRRVAPGEQTIKRVHRNRSAQHSIQTPTPWNALQLAIACVFEHEA